MSKELVSEFVVWLSASEVRSLCIEKHFYTRGDCKAYENMLGRCDKALTADDLVEIAQDIVEHSDPDNEWLKSYEALDEVICYLQDLCKVAVKQNIVTVEEKRCVHAISPQIRR